MRQDETGIAMFRYSTEGLPDRDKLESWRNVIGQALAKADFEPAPGVPFSQTAAIRILPRLSLVAGSGSGYRVSGRKRISPPMVATISTCKFSWRVRAKYRSRAASSKSARERPFWYRAPSPDRSLIRGRCAISTSRFQAKSCGRTRPIPRPRSCGQSPGTTKRCGCLSNTWRWSIAAIRSCSGPRLPGIGIGVYGACAQPDRPGAWGGAGRCAGGVEPRGARGTVAGDQGLYCPQSAQNHAVGSRSRGAAWREPALCADAVRRRRHYLLRICSRSEAGPRPPKC